MNEAQRVVRQMIAFEQYVNAAIAGIDTARAISDIRTLPVAIYPDTSPLLRLLSNYINKYTPGTSLWIENNNGQIQVRTVAPTSNCISRISELMTAVSSAEDLVQSLRIEDPTAISLIERAFLPGANFVEILKSPSIRKEDYRFLLRALLQKKIERAFNVFLERYPLASCPLPVSNDILFYFSGSADKPVGRGTNETVANPNLYRNLSAIPHWRRILSNFHVGEFTYNGKRYRTAEHAFQAEKIRLVNPSLADTFSLESGTPLSQGDGNAARAARKIAILPPAQIREWDRIKSEVMKNILLAKFTSVPEARGALLATGNAQLWHGAPRTPKARQFELEEVRDLLRNSQ